MIIYGCNEIHPRGYGGWIIVMWFKVLLITHYLIWEILVKAVLDINARGVEIKKLSIKIL
jgi:hypothetical protein